MQTVKANGIELAYETFGKKTDPPMLLIMGLGTQMIAWQDAMCEGLADAGHHVIRFDNRDCGLTTKVDAPTRRVVDPPAGEGDPVTVRSRCPPGQSPVHDPGHGR